MRISRMACIVGDEVAEGARDGHELEDAGAGGVAGLQAVLAAARRPEDFAFAGGEELGHVVESVRGVGEVEGPAAGGAQGAHQPLGHDAAQSGGQKMRMHAQGAHRLQGAGGVGGVDRRENQVAGVGGADGDRRGFRIADLADHDDVRALANHLRGAVLKNPARWRD